MIRVYAVPTTPAERAELVERGWLPAKEGSEVMAEGSEPELIQVVVLPHIRPALERWLADHEMLLFRIPSEPDDLPTYGIAPTPALLDRVLPRGPQEEGGQA